MGLWILSNTVGRAAADFRITDTSNVALPDPGINNLRGGPRTWKVSQENSPSYYIYVNKGGGLQATHAVIAGASGLAGKNIYLRSWATYTGADTIHQFYAPFDEDTYGIDGSDFVVPLGAVTGKQAFGLSVTSGSDIVEFLKLYFCQGLEFTKRAGPLSFRRMPVWQQPVKHGRNYYKLHGTAAFVVTNVTRAVLNTFLALPKDDAVFLYDDTGGSSYGNFLPEKLWHAIILKHQSVQIQDDLYSIRLDVGILKHGSG